jgi:shikimate kinase
MSGMIVLIGPPGAGKTTVGRLLAASMGWEFIDTDQLIEDDAGASVPQIFLSEGEAGFRRREAAAVRAALGSADDASAGRGGRVVALGGGAPMDPASAALLDGSMTVFLDVSAAEGVRRTGLSGPRPLLADSPRARWRSLMAERRPVYARLAGVTVTTDGLPPRQIAAEISRLVGDGAAKGLRGEGSGR